MEEPALNVKYIRARAISDISLFKLHQTQHFSFLSVSTFPLSGHLYLTPTSKATIMTHPEEAKSNGLETIDTMGSINIPRDVFEKLYLTPQSQVKGELRKTFANPTPL